MSRTTAIVIVAALAAGMLAFVIQLRRAELRVADVVRPGAAPSPTSITQTITATAAVRRGERIDFLRPQAFGDRVGASDRPMIANVAVVDLDGDRLVDVVAADAATNRITWLRQSPAGRFTERSLAEVPARLTSIPSISTATATSTSPWPAWACSSPTTPASAR